MSDNSSLSSLSDHEEPPERNRFIRDRTDPFFIYNEHQFQARFRFSKQIVMEFLHIFGNNIKPTTNRNKSVSSLMQILIALRFYATGAFQQVVGDTFNIHKSTICRIIHRVTHQIALLKPQYINMPNNQDTNKVTYDFLNISGFPNVIGAIDCTHIKIKSPGGQEAELFRNRKGYFSINVQLICDANLKIRHIISRWPGSVHDSTIFNDSPLPVLFENGHFGNYFLLGDSGYPCRKYLLTPFINPQTASEESYNRAHITTRNTIERCIGVLKKRFPCLHLGMSLKKNRVPPVIIACAVLHNIARNMKTIMEDNFVFEPMENEALNLAFASNENTAVRTALLNTTFL